MASAPKVCKVLRLIQQVVKRDHLLSSSSKNLALDFDPHIPTIAKLVSDIRKDDLNFRQADISKRAPVTYIEIFEEDKVVSASIFAMQEGCSLPMHNHPRMYGFIKCISGAIKITSFSEVSRSATTEPQNDGGYAAVTPLVLTAKREPDLFLTEASDEVAVLTPSKGNIHSISAVDGHGAFVDFLVPPYLNDNCNYFFVDPRDLVNGDVVLREIDCPSWYWCASGKYQGPPIDVSHSNQEHSP